MPDTVLSAYLSLKITLGCRYYYCPHFAVKETEAKSLNDLPGVLQLVKCAAYCNSAPRGWPYWFSDLV